MATGRVAHGKVLWTLADACSMMLQPKSLNEPFKPFIVTPSGRSARLEDFQTADIDFLAEIVDLINHVWLKARVADIVWVRDRKRGQRYALSAIDAYQEIPINIDSFLKGGRECWERAISLSISLKSVAIEKIIGIDAAITAALGSLDKSDGFLAIWLAELLSPHRIDHSKCAHIANVLELLAKSISNDNHVSCAYFQASADWYIGAGNTEMAVKMTIMVAEGWVKEAESRSSTEQSGHACAATFFEDAIKVYRTIPRRERATYNIDERIAELHRKMNSEGIKSLDQMGTFSTQKIDITDFVRGAREAVQGKNVMEALKELANVHGGAKFSSIQGFAKKLLNENPLQQLFAATYVSGDGRTIAKLDGFDFGDESSQEYQAVVWAQMVRHYRSQISLIVQANICPALEAMLLEHRLQERDFIALALRSPIVPNGRHLLFGKALFAGYEQDFASSIHILIPQIENLVRVHLKELGVKTTNLDKKMIEKENGMSALMDLPEVEDIFGEDLTFELRALFCDAFGPNLRNELAHGLLNDAVCQSAESVYVWWFGLRLVFNTFWNAAHSNQTQ